jgi:hypothetical protein
VTLADFITATPVHLDLLQVRVVIGETSFTHTGLIEDVIGVVPHNFRDVIVKAKTGRGAFKDEGATYHWAFVSDHWVFS